MTRRLSLFSVLAWLSLSPWLNAQATAKYDLAFRRWGQFYAPWSDWRWFRAQAVVESGLNPDAVSQCGARGLMQLMPATAKTLGVDADDPEQNIQGGVHYDAMLWAAWSSVAGTGERRRFMFASYNAGPGSIQRAQALADGALEWAQVAEALPRVTGWHAPETVAYVGRIERVYERAVGGGR